MNSLSTSWVQILDNALLKAMYSSLLCTDTGKIVKIAGHFNLNMATSLGEGKNSGFKTWEVLFRELVTHC